MSFRSLVRYVTMVGLLATFYACATASDEGDDDASAGTGDAGREARSLGDDDDLEEPDPTDPDPTPEDDSGPGRADAADASEASVEIPNRCGGENAQCPKDSYMKACTGGKCLGTGCCCATSRFCRAGSVGLCCPEGQVCKNTTLGTCGPP